MKKEIVKFQSSNRELMGEILNPGESRGVLVIHGSSDKGRAYGARKNQTSKAEPIISSGFSCFVFDMSGYGDSEGDLEKLSIKDHLEDTVAAYDFFKKHVSEIHVLGGSYGGYLAPLLAAQRKVESLTLKSPAIYQNNVFHQEGTYKSEFLDYRNSGEFSDTKAIRAIANFSGPTYIIGAELDECVPKRVVDEFYVNAGSTNKKIDWIKGATHSPKDDKSKEAYLLLLKEWYSNLI